ncbi:MAG TPA: STAS/SEC14 domain-containing protein [Planctomycetota bacterium]|nr:STAS/SEC14 domain-containing protein [Planctomycetota bacterium]
MGVDYRIYPKERAVVSHLRGRVTGRDILEYQARVWTDPAVAGFAELMDFSDASRADVSVEDIRELARRGHAIDAPVCSRMALVAGSALARTGMHIFKALRESIPGGMREIRVFDDARDARAWLGLPEGCGD